MVGLYLAQLCPKYIPFITYFISYLSIALICYRIMIEKREASLRHFRPLYEPLLKNTMHNISELNHVLS